MDNQQLYNLENEELQVLLSLYFGDGCYRKQNLNSEYSIHTSSVKEKLLEYKKSLLKTLRSTEIKLSANAGYKKDGQIYKMWINNDYRITNVFNLSFEDKLKYLDDLGIALWFYDDGSLHKTKLFYNLSTHSFSVEEQLLILEKLKEFNIYGKLLPERKKDGRCFWYITISKYYGAFEISKILEKYKIEDLEYKLWSSTTIQKWSTFQEKWKSEGGSDIEDFVSKMKYIEKYKKPKI